MDRSSKPSNVNQHNQHAENRRIVLSASERKARLEPVNRTGCVSIYFIMTKIDRNLDRKKFVSTNNYLKEEKKNRE